MTLILWNREEAASTGQGPRACGLLTLKSPSISPPRRPARPFLPLSLPPGCCVSFTLARSFLPFFSVLHKQTAFLTGNLIRLSPIHPHPLPFPLSPLAHSSATDSACISFLWPRLRKYLRWNHHELDGENSTSTNATEKKIWVESVCAVVFTLSVDLATVGMPFRPEGVFDLMVRRDVRNVIRDYFLQRRAWLWGTVLTR